MPPAPSTGEFLSGLPDDAIEILCRFHLSRPSTSTGILLLPDGRMSWRCATARWRSLRSRRRSTSNPLAVGGPRGRRGQHHVDARAQRGARAVHDGPRVWNFIGDEGEERVVASFGPDGY